MNREHLRCNLVRGVFKNKLKNSFRLMKTEELTFENTLKEELQDKLAEKYNSDVQRSSVEYKGTTLHTTERAIIK